MGLTYKSAGLDLDLYDKAMARLPALMKRTHTPRVQELADGFAGLFHLGSRKKYRRNYEDPVLVSGTDGVGTKLKVAIAARRYDTVGIDLVAMSVNDCLCLGAEPLFFLDYLALAKDDPDLIAALVSGVSAGCVEAGAALLGGETAIMPDMYSPGDFDMAGFCVAVAERDALVDGSKIRPKDVAIGVDSSGLHSNGYSLVRKIVFERAKLRFDAQVPAWGKTVSEELLTPTRIYVKPVLDLLAACGKSISGLAHITAGDWSTTPCEFCRPTANSCWTAARGSPLLCSRSCNPPGRLIGTRCIACSIWGSGSSRSCDPRRSTKCSSTSPKWAGAPA